MCKITKEITSKINKLKRINDEIVLFPDDLIRLPAILEADCVREELLEKPEEYKKELEEEAKKYSDNIFKKNIALKTIDE